jgi:hypothetical protein
VEVASGFIKYYVASPGKIKKPESLNKLIEPFFSTIPNAEVSYAYQHNNQLFHPTLEVKETIGQGVVSMTIHDKFARKYLNEFHEWKSYHIFHSLTVLPSKKILELARNNDELMYSSSL